MDQTKGLRCLVFTRRLVDAIYGKYLIFINRGSKDVFLSRKLNKYDKISFLCCMCQAARVPFLDPSISVENVAHLLTIA